MPRSDALMRTSRASLVAVALVALAGCRSPEGDARQGGADPAGQRERGDAAPAVADGTITGEPWRLVAIRRPGGIVESVGPDPEYTVQFGEDGRYSGRAHCNSFTGGYE